MLCRLLPLAISSIYEVTSSRDEFSAEVANAISIATDKRRKHICLQLKGKLRDLQDCHQSMVGETHTLADRQATKPVTFVSVLLQGKEAAFMLSHKTLCHHLCMSCLHTEGHLSQCFDC